MGKQASMPHFQQLGASGKGVDPAAATLAACSRWPGREGSIFAQGGPGTCNRSVLPASLPCSFFHACTLGLQVSTLHPLPGPWPVCQLQSPQLASSGRRANIYSSEAHRGRLRRTKDWCEFASHPNRGLSLLFNQAPGSSEGFPKCLLFMLSSGLPVSFY